jgi:D-alanyl-D-alanine carboxypeptidase/D-alanyl-D-alanine endopeptidase (penicillin-binding protein 7)
MNSKPIKALCIFLLLGLGVCQAASLQSEHVFVVSDDTGQILLSKGANTVAPIASLTKLMTAMVVLDSKPDMNETISIQASDVDMLKHSKSHVPIGTTLKRREIFELALMSSDNCAAASLARTVTSRLNSDSRFHAM